MLLTRAYKTELDPNKEQRSTFLRCAGAARFVYNWALADRIATYEATDKSGNLYEQKRRFNALKHEQFPWLQTVPYKVVEQAFANLDTAYKNFFRRVKGADKQKGFPRFKSRKRGIGSFTVRSSIYVEARRIKLPRIGWVRLKERSYLPCSGVKVLSANISEKAGRWFLSLQVEQEVPDPELPSGSPIGVDLGINALATTSEGLKIANPRTLYRNEKRLALLQRELCRRQKGSKNRAKTKHKVAKLHAKIANIRRHALHQASHLLTTKAKPSVIVVENLNVKGMMQNRHISKAAADASMSELKRQLLYKAAWRGIDVGIADMWFPSSKKCSSCGSVKVTLSLSERRYVCEACGVVIDRDVNAACNLRDLAAKRAVTACGEGVSPASSGQSSVKQEPGTDGPISPGPPGVPGASYALGLNYAQPLLIG